MRVTSNGYQALWTTMLAVSHMSHSLRKIPSNEITFFAEYFWENEQKAIVLLSKRDYKKIERLRR